MDILHFSYCEQTPLLIIAQPLNTVSNLAFFFVAALFYRNLPKHDSQLRWLAHLCVLIGIGSILWHSVQQPWALAADILPIFVFLMFYQYMLLVRDTPLTGKQALLMIAGLLIAMGLASLVANDIFLQKSNAFVPVALWLGVCGWYFSRRAPAKARYCSLAAAAFSLAILMRIIDMPVCDTLSRGTHSLWHGLSALTLYFAMRALLENPHEEAAHVA